MKLIRPSTIGRRRWVLFALAATALALSASALAEQRPHRLRLQRQRHQRLPHRCRDDSRAAAPTTP